MAVFQQKNLYFTSLGCSKNLVDSQVMLGLLKLDGFSIATRPEDAEVIIVNTCSFINAAKTESIDTILEMSDFKIQGQGQCRLLIATGCLAQRYSQSLETELPEVDFFVGTGEYQKIGTLVKAWEEGSLNKKSFVEIPRYIHTELDPRLNTSPPHYAWLKISEGCNRNCTFCIIPSLRGRLRSRTVESLIAEAQSLAATGVKELNLISQDLSDYGVDLSESDNLFHLLKGLERVDGVSWIRLFYFYPDDLTDEVMQLIGRSQKICHYLDMPIQHFSSQILRRMNRKISQEEILAKIRRLKNFVPNIVLRTSVIVGFPGETEEDFEKLKAGIEEFEFDHLGVFQYSDEDGTPAQRLKNKVAPEIIERRFHEIYEIQQKVLEKKNQRYLHTVLQVLVEGHHEETDLLLVGRHQGQAPDIDGQVIINSGKAQVGEFKNVLITEVAGYDLIGHIVDTLPEEDSSLKRRIATELHI